MGQGDYFNTFIQIAWPAKIVTPGWAVHSVPRSRKNFGLTHVRTGLSIATSTSLDLLEALASELTRRCEKLDFDNRNHVRKTIPESLTLYIMFVRKGGQQSYTQFCAANRLLPAPIVREQTGLPEILDSDL